MSHHISGVLPDHEIQKVLADGGLLAQNGFEDTQLQPASLDLRLGHEAIRIRASFLPGPQRSVQQMLDIPGMALHRMRLSEQGTVLETGCVYLVALQESARLTKSLYARANPKSSTGRIDVFTRLVTDRSNLFDEVAPGYSGPLWLEISPRTFPILVRPGDRLAQLRLKQGEVDPVREQIVSIDLDQPETVPVGWRAKRHGGLIDLKALGKHAVSDFWEPLYARKGQLVLDPEEFYILASQENVAIPDDLAAEMAAIAPELGEFRAHYAGFFDPGFGTNESGSRAVLEVRSRDVPFILQHGQAVARLVFEPMQARPDKVYGGRNSNYQGQGLRLSKHFESPESR